jgi:hypothetical protein
LAACGTGTEPTPGPPPAREPAAVIRRDAGSDPRLAEALGRMRARLERAGVDPDGFHFVVEPPFVVAGDEDRDTVELRSDRVVRWAVDRLKAAYFERDPAAVIEIWLFRDGASYRKHAGLLFGDKPSTPYGYYSSEAGALIMDISTGGGTLVHEIVHPFVAANLPGCPDWFNEGLGSLYEQSSERGGQIIGLTNWRLAGLQDAFRARRAPSLAELVATSQDDFYGEKSGLYYAEARYLLYYLQEKDLLSRFYRTFAAGLAADPTGRAALEETLGQDLPAFEPTFKKFVMALRFSR